MCLGTVRSFRRDMVIFLTVASLNVYTPPCARIGNLMGAAGALYNDADCRWTGVGDVGRIGSARGSRRRRHGRTVGVGGRRRECGADGHGRRLGDRSRRWTSCRVHGTHLLSVLLRRHPTSRHHHIDAQTVSYSRKLNQLSSFSCCCSSHFPTPLPSLSSFHVLTRHTTV